MSQEQSQRTDQELIDYYFHENSGQGAEEILKRGERMIPWLIRLKGNRKLAWPAGLGNPNSARAWNVPLGKPKPGKSVYDLDGDVVTEEVVGLYLTCAIYHGSLSFAKSPLLTDLSQPPEKRRDHNTQEMVDKAWASVETWAEALKHEGLSSLRTRKYDPLRGSNVAFW